MTGNVGEPAWSPLGDKIAYGSSQPGLSVMNSDGSGATLILASSVLSYPPSWSPNEKKIVFGEYNLGPNANKEIFIVNADGSGLTQITHCNCGQYGGSQSPSWSPDGTKITFSGAGFDASYSDIYTMNPDGSGRLRLTNCGSKFNAGCWFPRWSSDGKQVVFEVDSQSGVSIYKMNNDGSNVTLLLPNSGLALDTIDCSRCASFGKL